MEEAIAIVCSKCRKTRRFGKWIKLTEDQWLSYKRYYEIKEEFTTCEECKVLEIENSFERMCD